LDCKMNVSALAMKVPVPQLATAAGAVILFLGIRSFAGFENGNPPSLTVKGFRIGDVRNSFVDSTVADMPIPEVRYEVMSPFGTRPERIEAWLVGEGGVRLALERQTWSAQSFTFGRRGYSQTLRAPRIVVRYADKVVLDQAVPPIMPALRAIPLVVPIASDVSLRPLPKGTRTPKVEPAENAYRIVGLDTQGTPDVGLRIRATEWSPWPQERLSTDRKGNRLVSVPNDVEMGGFVELIVSSTREEKSVRFAEAEIEIYRAGDETRIRLIDELLVKFDRGGWLHAPPQSRVIPADPEGGVRRKVAFSLRDLTPKPALFLLSATNLGGGIATAPASMASVDTATIEAPVVARRRPYTVELLSPTLADLGLRKLIFGPYELIAPPEDPLKPLVLGRHRLKLRITLEGSYPLDLRRFIAVGP
jgi:hypothetical protein